MLESQKLHLNKKSKENLMDDQFKNNLPKILPPAIILNPQLSTSRSLKAKSATYRLSYD